MSISRNIFECAIYDGSEFDRIYGLLRGVERGTIQVCKDPELGTTIAENVRFAPAADTVCYSRTWLTGGVMVLGDEGKPETDEV
jgi:hypothetical protein